MSYYSDKENAEKLDDSPSWSCSGFDGLTDSGFRPMRSDGSTVTSSTVTFYRPRANKARSITCRNCGAKGLHWRNKKLYKDGNQHRCWIQGVVDGNKS